MYNLNIWTSYHKNNIPEQYNLKEKEGIKLFNTTNLSLHNNNINYLNKYIGELCTIYYVWKNYIYSDYIGFQHYRYLLTNTNIHNNEIIVERGWKGEFYKSVIKPSGIYSYTYMSILKYLSEYSNISLHDIIHNYFINTNNNIFIANTFICSWEMFDDLCKFIFGYLDNIFPNESWKYENNLYEHIKNIFDMFDYEHDYINPNKIENNWAIKFFPDDKRYFIMLFEYMIPLFFNVRYPHIKFTYNSIENQKFNKILIIDLENKNCSIEDFNKTYFKNFFSGIKDFRIINYKNSGIWEEYIKCPPILYDYKWLTFSDETNYNVDNKSIYKIKAKEYIDVISPNNFYKTNNYIIKTIK